MSDIVFVILNWNKSDMTIQAIKNIENVEHGEYGIIVVDNNSEAIEREKLMDFASSNNWQIIDEGNYNVNNKSVFFYCQKKITDTPKETIWV